MHALQGINPQPLRYNLLLTTTIDNYMNLNQTVQGKVKWISDIVLTKLGS